MTAALANRENPDRGFHVALRTKVYQDAKEKEFIHLLDGGVSDNLGIQSPLEHSIYGRRNVLGAHRKQPRRSVMIIVNARNMRMKQWNFLSKTPGLGSLIDAVSGSMINNHNFATVEFMRASYDAIQKRLDAEGTPYDHYLIEISLEQLSDATRREHLIKIPTALSLPKKEVDAVRDAAKEILYSSGRFRALVADLGGTLPE